MKRFIFPTLLFYLCSFAAPPPAHAYAQLAVVAVGAVAAGCLATSGAGQYHLQANQSPSYVPASSDGTASASDYMFMPAYLAAGAYNVVTKTTFPAAQELYLAKTAAIGASIGTIFDAVNASASNVYTGLKSVYSSNQTGGVFDSSLAGAIPSGSIVLCTNGSKVKLTGPTSSTGTDGSVLPGQYSSATYKFPIAGGGCFSVASTQVGEWHCYNGSSWNGTWLTKIWIYNGASTTNDPTLNPPPYVVDYNGLKTSLSHLSSQVAEEVKDILSKTSPPAATTAGSVPTTVANASSAPTLTQTEINNWYTTNNYEVAQAAADQAASAAAADPTNAQAAQAAADAAVIAAQAAADAADPEEEAETFSAINASPFQNAYNPGSFDIPTRFTTFLQNVKTSGLFSFSSAFFDSLPGGGSPVYTVHAGHYGTHTIDLSDTMSTGLAVLKSILLACFGFLSIRAVIMKR